MDAQLIRPSPEYFLEFQKAGSDQFGRTATAAAYIDEMRKAEHGRATGVARTEFWFIVDDYYAGRIQIRHEPSGRHPLIPSHVYYEIAPARRGKGFGKVLLRLGLQKAMEMGIDPVLIACEENNAASLKIIERCGGILLRTAKFPNEPHRLFLFAFGSYSERLAA